MKYSEFRRWLLRQGVQFKPGHGTWAEDKRLKMKNYPVNLTRDTNGAYLVDVIDIPEAHAVGDDEVEALRNAAEAIETALEMYAEQRRPIPLPSRPQAGQRTVGRLSRQSA